MLLRHCLFFRFRSFAFIRGYYLEGFVAVVPGDNLVVEGVPPIPDELAERVARYTDLRQALLLSWHPKRHEILIQTRFVDTGQVHLVKMPGGARTQLTFFPDTVRNASFPRRRDDYFVFSKDAGGNEFAQNYCFELETGDITLLTDGSSQNTLGPWSHKGDRMAYTSTRRNGTDRDIYMVDPANPKSDRLVAAMQGGGWYPLDWSPDDRSLMVMEYVSINESYLWLLDVQSGCKHGVTPRDGGERVAYGYGQFSADGRGLYVTTDRESEFLRLAYVDPGDGRHTYLTNDIPWDVEEFDTSPDGRTIAFVTNEDGFSVLHLLDVTSGSLRSLPAAGGGVLSNLHWHADSHVLGFCLQSNRSPADVYSLTTESGTVARWTISETGGLNLAAFPEPELVRWKSFDGLSISGLLYMPPARFEGKRPVIINIHGGPESQARPRFQARNNYLIHELGAAMLFPNVRGSAGYGKTFLQLDNGYLREGAYRDIEALLDWVATRPDLDAGRIMVTGGSYGGHMTLAVATRYNDRIRCSLDIVGPSNLVTLLENTESYRRDLRRVEYGDERVPEMRAFLERIAPVNHARNITRPLFVVQGRNDPRVPYTESLQMIEAVRANGTPVWFLMANDEGHGFAKKRNMDFQFYATLLFVQQFLLNPPESAETG